MADLYDKMLHKSSLGCNASDLSINDSLKKWKDHKIASIDQNCESSTESTTYRSTRKSSKSHRSICSENRSQYNIDTCTVETAPEIDTISSQSVMDSKKEVFRDTSSINDQSFTYYYYPSSVSHHNGYPMPYHVHNSQPFHTVSDLRAYPIAPSVQSNISYQIPFTYIDRNQVEGNFQASSFLPMYYSYAPQHYYGYPPYYPYSSPSIYDNYGYMYQPNNGQYMIKEISNTYPTPNYPGQREIELESFYPASINHADNQLQYMKEDINSPMNDTNHLVDHLVNLVRSHVPDDMSTKMKNDNYKDIIDRMSNELLPGNLNQSKKKFDIPCVLVPPDYFTNPSTFLKVYGDPLCDKQESREKPIDERNGNWTCQKCKLVNYPRRLKCKRCDEKRDPNQDHKILDYARSVHQALAHGQFKKKKK